MDEFSNFRLRSSINGGTPSESIKNHSIEFINSKFKHAFYKDAMLEDGSEIEVRVINGKMDDERKVLLRPLTKIVKGTIIIFDDLHWLTFESDGSDTYPKLVVKRCNNHLKFISNNVTETVYCVVTKAVRFDVGNNNIDSRLLEGTSFLYASANELTNAFKVSQRFIIQNQVYEISGIDDISGTINGIGVIQFSIKISTSNVKDDFVNGIADNSHLKTNDGTQGGGRVW